MKPNRNKLIKSLEKGVHLPEGRTILHTAPHHDDILLAYHPLLKKLIAKNHNIFAYATSGFNSVTDSYIINKLQGNNEVESDYQSVLKSFLDAASRNDAQAMKKWESAILQLNMKKVFNLKTNEALKQKKDELLNNYFPNKKADAKDDFLMQILKGAMRESESDRKLLALGVDLSSIWHMRSAFYSQEGIKLVEQAQPFVELLEEVNPNIVTVACDPKDVGPKTHYKVLQMVKKGLEIWDKKTEVWAYRNVWSKFQLSEATIIAPVTEEELSEMHRIFMTCFTTQVEAAFPSPDFSGPFSKLAEKIQREQYAELKGALGESYFMENPFLREAAGVIYLREG